jgi:predicted ArsR family transcriptional regulator
VDPELPDRAASIGALAEPVRRELYAHVTAQQDAVSREQAAEAVGVPVHTARFHLDRLVEQGLLEVEFRRLTGRTGPGAGRPSKLYRRSPGEIAVSLPERRYSLLGTILAAGVDRARAGASDVDTAVRDVAREAGRVAGGQAPADGSVVQRLVDTLAGQGYEPRDAGDEVVLANCPFDSVAAQHTELVCGLNLCFVDGVVDGLGCQDRLEARLAPAEGLCCVRARPRTAG